MGDKGSDESDTEPFVNLERLFAGVHSKRNATKKLLITKKQPKEETSSSSDQKVVFRNEVDSRFVFNINKKLVRIEYPGNVKNIDNAISTLGGMNGIQKALMENRNKLELRFHPSNVFNKPCMAEKDPSPGILIKLNLNSPQETVLKEVVGYTAVNFKFTRVCDFQYVPIIPENEDNEESQCEYLYNKILPDKLPTLEWFTQKEQKEMPTFFLPACFSRFEITHNRLYLNASEKYGMLRPEVTNLFNANRQKTRPKHISMKNISVSIDFQKPNVQIPIQPLTYAMELVEERGLKEKYTILQRMFEERPISTKAAIQFKTGLSNDNLKILLPTVSYFCVKGPWRTCWIKLGYNPQKDFSSRIYQSLDYRIRTVDGLKLKVNPKRSYASKTVFYVPPTSVKRMSLNDSLSSKKANFEERSFLLRPNTIPPARQMFYQYCHILLPEIKGMLERLPKIPTGAKYDLKNGWLPENFTEHCREIVNRCVLKNVQEELLKDSLDQKEVVNKDDVPAYSSTMLDNIKKNFPRNIGLPSTSSAEQTLVDTIDLVVEETTDVEMEQVNVDEVIENSLPESIDDNTDDNDMNTEDENSDIEIDMEAVEEVNQMIGDMRENNEVDIGISDFLE